MKKKNVIILILLVIIIIGIIIGIHLMKNPKNKKKIPKDTTTNTQVFNGTFYDKEVTDFPSAKKAIESIKNDLNIKSIDELSEDDSYTNNTDLNTYSFYQTYDGIKVYNSSIMIYTDGIGNVHGAINNLKKISINTKQKNTKEDADKVIKEFLKKHEIDNYNIINNELLIYPYQDNYTLVYYYEIKIGPISLVCIIKEDTLKIIENYVSISNVSSDLTEEDYAEFKQEDGTYKLYDKKRLITSYYANTILREKHEYKWDSLEDAKKQNLDKILPFFKGTQQVYDYYLNNHGIKGFSNDIDGIEVYYGVTWIFNKDDFWHSENQHNNAYFAAENGLIFGKDISPNIDTIAHEYTHGIFYNNVGDPGKVSEDNLQAPSVYEAYADIMGLLIEAKINNQKIDWKISDRDIVTSSADMDVYNKYGYNQDKNLEEHYYSQIISHVAYKTSRFLNLDDYESLWYDSMRLLKGSNYSFMDCKYAVMRIADARYGKDIAEKINKEFERVGLKGLYTTKEYTDMDWEIINQEDVSKKETNENEKTKNTVKKDNPKKETGNTTNNIDNKDITKSEEKKDNISTEENDTNIKNNEQDIKEENKTITISTNEAKQILIKNNGSSWNNIPVDYQYIAKVKYNNSEYYVFIEYADNNFMNAGGEWLEQVDNGKYYVSTYFVATSYENNGNIACNYAKNYENTKGLTNDASYSGYVYDNWCSI